jgi:hypothetical protein
MARGAGLPAKKAKCNQGAMHGSMTDNMPGCGCLAACLLPAGRLRGSLIPYVHCTFLSFFLFLSFFYERAPGRLDDAASHTSTSIHTYLVHAAAGDPAVIPSQHAARQQIQHGSERARRPAAQAQAAGSTACGAAAFPLLTPPARCGPFTSRRCARASPLRADSPAGACLRGWAAWAAWGACHRCAHPKHFFHLTSPA